MSDPRPRTGELRRTRIQRALHRQNLVLGGERELVMFSALVAGGLMITAQNIVAIIVGVPLWLGAIYFLRQMAKADPQMSTVYRRQLTYAAYYAARSTAFRRT